MTLSSVAPSIRKSPLAVTLMTSDKVSLRMNALVTYRIADARKAVSSTEDVRQALRRAFREPVRYVINQARYRKAREMASASRLRPCSIRLPTATPMPSPWKRYGLQPMLRSMTSLFP
mgnify:CR=1 FL=1